MELHTILVVDDDFLVRMTIAAVLSSAGFDVIEASDAGSALDILKEQPGIDLVCTDVNMPGDLDGIGLARRVREDYPLIKIMVVSGCGENRSPAPDIPFLAKPFLSGRLIELVREQLALRSSEGPAGGLQPTWSQWIRRQKHLPVREPFEDQAGATGCRSLALSK